MKVWRKKLSVLSLAVVFCVIFSSFASAATVNVGDLLSTDLSNWVVTYGTEVQNNSTLYHDGKLFIDGGQNEQGLHKDVRIFYKGSKGPKDGDTIKFKLKVVEPGGDWLTFWFRQSALQSDTQNLYDATTSKYLLWLWGPKSGNANKLQIGGWDDAHVNQGLTDFVANPFADGKEHIVELTTKNVENGVEISVKIDGQDPFGLTGGSFVDTTCKYSETGFFGFQGITNSGTENIKFELSSVTETSSSSSSIASSSQITSSNPTSSVTTSSTTTSSTTSRKNNSSPNTGDVGILLPLIAMGASGAVVFIKKNKKK